MSSIRGQKDKSGTLTVRVDKALLENLRREATQRQISLNTLTNQILRQYEEWHNEAARAGFISVQRGLIVRLMDKASDEDIAEIAKCNATKESKSYVMLLRHEYNIKSALDVTETWLRISGFPYRHKVTDSTHSFVIQHDMGKKWSNYLVELYRSRFEEFNLKPKFYVTDNTLAFELDIGQKPEP